MLNIRVYENSSVDMMAAAIAAELSSKGAVTLETEGGAAALDRAIKSVNLAKDCMPNYSITLGKAVSHMGDATLLLRAQTTNGKMK